MMRAIHYIGGGAVALLVLFTIFSLTYTYADGDRADFVRDLEEGPWFSRPFWEHRFK